MIGRAQKAKKAYTLAAPLESRADGSVIVADSIMGQGAVFFLEGPKKIENQADNR